jgi:hypothetical protein
VGSARELERLAQSDAAYRWLAGGVPLNYRGLADFRVDSVEVLDRLLTQSVTALIAEGLISLGSRSQSTARRFAPAPARSRSGQAKNCSRSKARLALAFGRSQAGAFERSGGFDLVDGKPRGSGRRVMFRSAPARRGRRSNGFRPSASRAPRHTPRNEAKKKEPKASTTDPEARSMRFPDGAVRPAYNAQIAAAPKEGVIAVTDRRNDAGLAGPMVNDIVRRYGRTPDRLLVDTSYATSEDIVSLAAHIAGLVSVYTPPPRERGAPIKPASLARRPRKREKEPACLEQWRERMASEAGQAVYALCQRIERINADRKNHGFGFLAVRGSSRRRLMRSGMRSQTISSPPTV